MVFLEAASIQPGGDYRVFYRAFIACLIFRNFVLYCGICFFGGYSDEDHLLWGSGCRLAVYDLYYIVSGRDSAFLYGYFGNVFVKDVFGDKEETDLYLWGNEFDGRAVMRRNKKYQKRDTDEPKR